MARSMAMGLSGGAQTNMSTCSMDEKGAIATTGLQNTTESIRASIDHLRIVVRD